MTFVFMQPISPLVQRKPLQLDMKKHPDEEDSCSVASSYPTTLLSLSLICFSLYLLPTTYFVFELEFFLEHA